LGFEEEASGRESARGSEAACEEVCGEREGDCGECGEPLGGVECEGLGRGEHAIILTLAGVWAFAGGAAVWYSRRPAVRAGVVVARRT